MTSIPDIKRTYQEMAEQHGFEGGDAVLRSMGYPNRESYGKRTQAFDMWYYNSPFNEYHHKGRYETVLDVGCGVGLFSEQCIELHYTGVDMVPEFIDIARAKFGASDCNFYEDNFLDGKFPPVNFDLVVAMGTTFMMDPIDVSRLVRKMWTSAARAVVFDVKANHWTTNGILAMVQRHTPDWVIRHLPDPGIYVVYMYRNPDATQE